MPGRPYRKSLELSRSVTMLLAGLLIAAGIFFTPTVGRAADESPAPDLVAVPDVIGLIGAEAIAAVREAGLEPQPEIERDMSTLTVMVGLSERDLPPGVVFGTHPFAGELVETGSRVTLRVTPEYSVVPDVNGLAEAEAVSTIEAAGLVPTLTVKHDKDVLEAWSAFTDGALPSGVVLYARPRAGEIVEPSSTVEVAMAPTLVAVPDVIDLIGAEAIAAVRAAGLEPDPVIEDDVLVLEMMEGLAELGGSTLSYGSVYATHPGAGELAEVGSTVTLKLPARIVVVPDVIALPEDVAVAALEGAGLGATPMPADDLELEETMPGYVDRPLPVAGSVLRTVPAGGERASEGTDVRVWLAPELVKMPEVTGLPEAEAVAVVEAAGLVPASVVFEAGDLFGWDTYAATDGSLPPVGEVIGSGPVAGWPLEPGSRVELWLMPPIVEVPDVMGLPEAEAVVAVQAAGLVPDIYVLEGEPLFGFPYDMADEPVPVVVQLTDPLPGELAMEGSTVALGFPPDLVKVPDVTDLATKKATTRIEKAGFVAEVAVERGEGFLDLVNATTDKPLKVSVLGTTPEAGSLAERGSIVTLHMPPELAKVPDVIDLDPKKAAARIEKAGFVPEIVVLAGEPLMGWPYEDLPGPIPVVVVEITYPFPGTLAERGSIVELGIPPNLVDMPSVAGLDYAAAASKVEAAGLVPAPREMSVGELSVVLMFTEDLPDPDLVLYSDPFAGERVEKGSDVELAFPPLLTVVPYVIDMAEDEAVAALGAAGLDAIPVFANDEWSIAMSSSDDPMTVYASEPDAGEIVTVGSIVEVYLPPEPPLDATAPGANARVVHTLFNLAVDEQGSSELACTYQGAATFETSYDWWSITYRGQNWHALDGAGVFVCGGDPGEQTIARGTFTTEPLEFTLDEYFVCDLDTFDFDGTVISGTWHQNCSEPDSAVYDYAVAVDLSE